jgi:hypothetical protein
MGAEDAPTMLEMLTSFIDKSITNRSRNKFKKFGVDKHGHFTKEGMLKALNIDSEEHAYY